MMTMLQCDHPQYALTFGVFTRLAFWNLLQLPLHQPQVVPVLARRHRIKTPILGGLPWHSVAAAL